MTLLMTNITGVFFCITAFCVAPFILSPLPLLKGAFVPLWAYRRGGSTFMVYRNYSKICFQGNACICL